MISITEINVDSLNCRDIEQKKIVVISPSSMLRPLG